MGITSIVLAGLLAVQGQAVQLRLTDEPGLTSASANWNGRTIPFVHDATGWTTVIGVDLDTAAGDHWAELELTFRDGSTRAEREIITVQAHEFPTTSLQVAPRYVEPNPEDQARAARESREIGAIYANLTNTRYWDEAFQSPLPNTSGGRNFGHRRIFNGQARAPHSGADLGATTGTPVHAANTGRVVLAKDLFFSGNAVFLDHGLGVYSVYLHLSEIQVELDQMVERGQVIGLAGATGRVTGPHLHWGVRILDARVDPFTLLTLGQ